MKNVLALVLAALVLGACASNQVITAQKIKVITPDPTMYNCPFNKTLPSPKTDIDVGRVLKTLYYNNATCKNSMEAIQSFLENAKTEAENTDK